MSPAPHSARKAGQLHPLAGAGWLCRCGLGQAPRAWIPGPSASTASHRQETPTGPRSGRTGAMRSTRAPSGRRQQHSARTQLERVVPVAGSPATACTVGGCVPPSLHGGPLSAPAWPAALACGRACVRGQGGRPE
jgi:hypothetical protein